MANLATVMRSLGSVSRQSRMRRDAFTLVELVLVIAVVSIVAAISAPLYVNWRATSLNTEAVRVVEQAISTSRVDAKRRATTVNLVLANGDRTISGSAGEVAIPNGGSIVTDAELRFAFTGALGVQDPYQIEEFDVLTGVGLFQRTSRVSIIPPLGKTVVSRR